jgi:teichuronic acid exporter
LIRDFFWDATGRLGNQAVSFLLSIVLTRLLKPEEYGIMGMAMVVIYVATLFLDFGFNKAIVQQKEVTHIQYSTIFYINLAASLILMTLCFFLADGLAHFYNQPLIRPVFRTVSLIFFFNALSFMPASKVYKQANFRAITMISISSAVISGIVGIILAYKGYGVWSLVAQTVTNSFLTFLFYTIYSRFVPLLQFQFKSVAPLWKYGSRLFASSFLDIGFTRLDVFLIGKIFQPVTLGFYTRAQTFEVFVRQMSSSSITSVLFPHISKHQDDRNYITSLFNRYLHMVLFLSVWLSGFLFLAAPHVFIFLFSSRWAFSGELYQLMALGAFIWPISNLMCCFIMALGNSKAFFRLEVFKKLFYIPVYCFGFLAGIKVFIVVLIASLYISFLLNIVYVRKEVDVDFWKQVKIIAVYVLTAVLSVLATMLAARFIPMNHFVSILFLFTVFSLVYLLTCYVLKLKGFGLVTTVLQKFKRR